MPPAETASASSRFTRTRFPSGLILAIVFSLLVCFWLFYALPLKQGGARDSFSGLFVGIDDLGVDNLAFCLTGFAVLIISGLDLRRSIHIGHLGTSRLRGLNEFAK